MTAKNGLCEIFRKFSGRRILIVGNMCLSRFEICQTIRFGHEAPVLALRHENEQVEVGRAGHVAVCIRALGGEPVPVGLIGNDAAGEELLAAFNRHSVDCDNIVVAPDRITQVIKRIYSGGHNTNRRQVLRIHYGERCAVTKEEETLLLERIEALLPRVDGIYLNHYGPGVATRKIWMALHDGARKHKIHSVVDGGREPFTFCGATVLIQSEYEMVEVLREREVETPNEAAVLARNIQRKAQSQAVILTRGNRGMVVVDGRKKPVHLGIYGPEDITDPTGVGETVEATTALALAAGATVVESARLASYAGGLSVMKPRLATVSAEELYDAACSRAL